MKSFLSSASKRNMQPPNLEFLRFEFEDLVFLFFLYQVGLIGRFMSHTKSFALKYYRYGYLMRNSDEITIRNKFSHFTCKVGHSYWCKPFTEWDTLICDPPIRPLLNPSMKFLNGYSMRHYFHG